MKYFQLCMGLLTLLFPLILITNSSKANGGGQDSPIIIVIVEPKSSEHPPDGMGYTATIGGVKYNTALGVLNGLKKTGSGKLVILLNRRVPVDAIPTIISLASKAINSSKARLFIFDDSRTEMMEIPGFNWVTFSIDPAVVGEM